MADNSYTGTSKDGLSRSIGQFQEFRLPRRPRFIQDLVPLKLEGATYLLGSEGQLLHGASTEWVLKVLAPLVDGTRTILDLQELFPDLENEAILDVLHLLFMNGLIEEGSDALTDKERGHLEEQFGSQLTFFSRYLRVTGRYNSRYRVMLALQQARVGIVGDAVPSFLLATRLAGLGIGEVYCSAPKSEVMSIPASVRSVEDRSAWPSVELLICVGPSTLQERMVRECVDSVQTMLSLDVSSLTLGPLTDPRASACWVCARLQHGDPRPLIFEGPPAIRQLWEHALIDRAAQQVLAHITGLFTPRVLRGVEIWQPSGECKFRYLDVLPLPNCTSCGKAITPLTTTLPSGHQESLALLYHRAAALQPWHMNEPATMQHHFSPGTQRLMRSAYLSYRWAPQVALPETTEPLDVSASEAIFGHASAPDATLQLDLEKLGTLLRYSAGGKCTELKEGGYNIRRYTASSGNLGSAELFVIALNVVGLKPGLYHYLLVNHTLETIREGHLATAVAESLADDLTGAADMQVDKVAAVFVVASAMERIMTKYADRGYLYGLLDAGLMSHRVDLLASQLGISAQMTPGFDDDRLAELLALDRIRYAPTAVVVLTTG